ncbi:MAG: hypothetical protein K0R31_554 [Clostridiales bacterium]|jgi:uncharacterized beta-barrel protein YwiB (DUF1934 family)|nr:hypothetical protein [Clostridiales bacterium]
MNKNVIISLIGSQTVEQDTNKIELVTEGKYYKKGSSYYITYRESEVTGLQGTTTTLKVSDSVITLMRFGAVNSQLIFEKGQKHISYFDTMNGAFTIGVKANTVDINVDDSGGEIRVDYQLELDNAEVGENDFYMHIREAGRPNDEHIRASQTGN